MSSSDDDGAYTVGFGKPPRQHRFKKGAPSPNPKGRPKKEATLGRALMDCLSEEVTVTGANGKKSKMSTAKAISKKAVAMAASGNAPMIRTMLAYETRQSAAREAQKPERDKTEEDLKAEAESLRVFTHALFFTKSCELYEPGGDGTAKPKAVAAPLVNLIHGLRYSQIRTTFDYQRAKSDCLSALSELLDEEAFKHLLRWNRSLRKIDIGR